MASDAVIAFVMWKELAAAVALGCFTFVTNDYVVHTLSFVLISLLPVPIELNDG